MAKLKCNNILLSEWEKNFRSKKEISIFLLKKGEDERLPYYKNSGAYLAGYTLEFFLKIAITCANGNDTNLRMHPDNESLSAQKFIQKVINMNKAVLKVIDIKKYKVMRMYSNWSINELRYNSSNDHNIYGYDSILELIRDIEIIRKDLMKLRTKYGSRF